MNVFEDLVVELQEENLLEKTFLDINRLEGRKTLDSIEETAVETDDDFSHDYGYSTSWSEPPSTKTAIDVASVDEVIDSGYGEPTHAEGEPAGIISLADQASEVLVEQTPVPKPPKNGQEFYKKRAMGEISSLQMVEHVITGVEREYMKIVPNAFDDFNAKKALNTFLQVSEDENSAVHAEAEFTLLNETEAWCSALAKRDRSIMVSSVRQYCENSRPALSSQALLALARFYRNLPYSEPVRSKFDFVVTRLFSRPAESEKRVCLFTKDEMVGHINTLYKDWSSIALYSASDDNSNEVLTMMSFEDLAVEAESASSFDKLIESDFFGRVRLFKESISELFYAPGVTASAIEANVRIGNAFVTLLESERRLTSSENIQAKYSTLQESAISDAAARTLDLVDLLKAVSTSAKTVVPAQEMVPEPEIESKPYPVAEAQPKIALKPKTVNSPTLGGIKEKLRSVNRTLLVVSMTLIAASFGTFIWSDFIVKDDVPTVSVKTVEVENSMLQGYAKSARVSGDNFYVMLLPAWDTLSKEKRQEFLQQAYKMAQEKGCTQVSLVGKDGKAAGFASASRLDVIMP